MAPKYKNGDAKDTQGIKNIGGQISSAASYMVKKKKHGM
jgi:hypothetical protein